MWKCVGIFIKGKKWWINGIIEMVLIIGLLMNYFFFVNEKRIFFFKKIFFFWKYFFICILINIVMFFKLSLNIDVVKELGLKIFCGEMIIVLYFFELIF